MTDADDHDQLTELLLERPDLEGVLLDLSDREVDAGVLLSDLRQRMTSVIDSWAYGFDVADYLPWSDVEALIRGGAAEALVSVAARYGAELIHSRYGSSELAWTPPPESLDLTASIDNLTTDGIDAGSAVFEAYLTRRDTDTDLVLPEELPTPADAVSAYTTAVALFALTVGEIERDLLDGATPPRPDEPASAGWIAQQAYALVARRLHRMRESAPETFQPWLDEYPDRDHVETALAVVDWTRRETGSALQSVEALAMMQRGQDPERLRAAATHIAATLDGELTTILDRVTRAVQAEPFRIECQNQNEAIGWPWQLINDAIVATLDERRRDICRSWNATDTAS